MNSKNHSKPVLRGSIDNPGFYFYRPKMAMIFQNFRKKLGSRITEQSSFRSFCKRLQVKFSKNLQGVKFKNLYFKDVNWDNHFYTGIK